MLPKVLKGHVQKAILLKELYGWCVVNAKKGSNVRHGIAWTYNSAAKLADKFYYMPSSSISRWLKELEKEKWLYSGNFNKKGYDRTKWYTVNYNRYINACKSLINTISQNDEWINQIENTISQNDKSINQIEQPIPSLTISYTSLKESESKKDTPTKEKISLSDFKKLQAENDRLNLELKNQSEAQKPKEKSSAKKEKVKHVFPSNEPNKSYKVNSSGFPSMEEFEQTPVHQNKITTKYEAFLKDYKFPFTWNEELKEKFLEWCQSKHEVKLGKFGATNVKSIIRKINDYLKTFEISVICKSIDLSLEDGYTTFDPQWILDRGNKKKQDAAKQQEQRDSNGKPLRSKYDRFAERNFGTQHTTDSATEDFDMQEF